MIYISTQAHSLVRMLKWPIHNTNGVLCCHSRLFFRIKKNRQINSQFVVLIICLLLFKKKYSSVHWTVQIETCELALHNLLFIYLKLIKQYCAANQTKFGPFSINNSGNLVIERNFDRTNFKWSIPYVLAQSNECASALSQKKKTYKWTKKTIRNYKIFSGFWHQIGIPCFEENKFSPFFFLCRLCVYCVRVVKSVSFN